LDILAFNLQDALSVLDQGEEPEEWYDYYPNNNEWYRESDSI